MIDKLKAKIQLAEQAAENVSDIKLKEKAFEVILNNLLHEQCFSQQATKNPVSNKDGISSQDIDKTADVDFDNSQNKDTAMNNLLKATGINNEKIHSIIDFDDEHIHIIGTIPGNSDSMKQKNATVLLLTIKHYLRDEKEITASDLKEKLQALGIGSLSNLASNLKGFENYIIMKGVKGSSNTIYRITSPGINCGIELIKEMAI